MNTLAKRALKTTAMAGAGLVMSAAAAWADCSVQDYDKKGFLGLGNATYTRQFSGNNAENIWQKYCKPYIQDKIASKGILNGEFSMRCSGSISCRVEGIISNGSVQTRRLEF